MEAELGRSLLDGEQVSIMAFAPHEAPTGEARAETAFQLQQHLKRIDHATKSGPEEETEKALNEAIRTVRPGYRERE